MNNMNENIGLLVKGHVHIEDDLGNTLLDKDNAIHPRNLSRIIARALANEPNSSVYRIALGNGGTLTDASFNVIFNTTNDGLPPDDRTWNSRLHNETYSEVVDDTSTIIGTDIGSSDSSGDRPGGGSNSGDEVGTGVVSNDLGNTSEVIITSIINANEPRSQAIGGNSSRADGSFVFDEIGLYTSGATASDSVGYANIDVGTKKSKDPTNLINGATYNFNIEIDGGAPVNISFTVPNAGSGPSGEILFGDMIEAINTGNTNWNSSWITSPLPAGGLVKISDETSEFPSITGSETFGYLQFVSGNAGNGSTVKITPGQIVTSGQSIVNNDLFGSNGLDAVILTPVDGSDAGVENNSSNANRERERLLTHLIFQPIYKSSERQITIKYTLTVAVGRAA